MSKLGTTTPHYSDDPVDVKGLVSKFTKVSVVKLPPEKLPAKKSKSRLLVTKTKQDYNHNNSTTDNNSMSASREGGSQVSQEKSENEGEAKESETNESNEEVESGEGGSTDTSSEQQQSSTNRRRKRQGSDDGYNSATSSDTTRVTSSGTSDDTGQSSEASRGSSPLTVTKVQKNNNSNNVITNTPKSSISETNSTSSKVPTSFKDLYSVRKLLSESSINKIYLGVHRTTGQEVVIKKLVKCQESLNELVYTKAASKIAPKYCLPILYSEKTNSSYVMVIPKYGLSLYDFMYERQETLSFEEARRTFKKILKALCKLQRYQIYHFDIKEENVCIDPQTLNIKLIDFGGAAQSMPTRFTGSFEFAAPEMFMKVPAKEAAAQADVWSFGVSLYSAVCGVTPYTNIDEVFEPRFRRKFDEKRGDLHQ